MTQPIRLTEYDISNLIKNTVIERGNGVSYTHVNAQPQGRPYFDTNMLREGLIAEVYAINGYAEYNS